MFHCFGDSISTDRYLLNALSFQAVTVTRRWLIWLLTLMGIPHGSGTRKLRYFGSFFWLFKKFHSIQYCTTFILVRLQVIVYSNLTDQEARYLARLGNTQNAIQRPNTIYEFLKSFRRLNYEFFQVSDNLEVPVVDKIQAGKINQRFLAENPSIVVSLDRSWDPSYIPR